ncbi:MerR-like DNA binding protein [Sphaerotilus hippei]|uniref:MerR-like DNA binding protein n=1 Tax=Sphaerotilus hippei TaxID=744406 RepID=A0A318H6M4_9BURK|nr:MerR family transcriptional regulator [Sphaerotilus hippei]PXW98098.1 MerR-like DNA binding protein [Sphaerotilus hippei]
MENSLPEIPSKRYFTIGEVSELCGVKPYVLRYWEQEFTQLRPMKRRGNRRYYQHHEVLLIRRIRDLLYEQGFTISGARNRLSEPGGLPSADRLVMEEGTSGPKGGDFTVSAAARTIASEGAAMPPSLANSAAATPKPVPAVPASRRSVREELLSIRALLAADE